MYIPAGSISTPTLRELLNNIPELPQHSYLLNCNKVNLDSYPLQGYDGMHSDICPTHNPTYGIMTIACTSSIP